MTPLAHRIVKELTLPLSKRTFDDQCGLLKMMDDIHCFEVTDIIELAEQIAKKCKTSGYGEAASFLPAPKTWIEWHTDVGRVGLLLDEVDQKAEVSVALETHFKSLAHVGFIQLTSGKPSSASLPFDVGSDEHESAYFSLLAMLAIINTPRIIGRRQHMPHRGLERKLVAARPMVGKFPLHAWTEIKLQVTPPQDLSGEASTEAHLTGERALHFCRAHLRIRLGRLEVVRAHWRGDASLGIRRSRYKVTA